MYAIDFVDKLQLYKVVPVNRIFLYDELFMYYGIIKKNHTCEILIIEI